jgi:ACS family hexuronate transporter-like MFS transporter
VILGLILAGTIINYIDRQTVSVLAPQLQADLHLSNFQYAKLTTWFLLSYTSVMWLWGAVADRIGNRRGLALVVAWWSLAEMAHALARGLASLSFARAALGLGESGHWPVALRTIAMWFSEKQRAWAIGIANVGAAFGSAVSPPLIVWLQLRYGWKVVFLVTGGFGVVWLAAWLTLYPGKKNGATFGNEIAPREPEKPPVTWSVLLRRREVWGIVAARFFGDPIWWLYLNWLPLYLSRARGFSLKEIGLSAWVPYVAAGCGCFIGGWLSGRLIEAGWTVNRARKTAIAIGTLCMPAGIAAAYAQSPYVALAFISVTLFGFQFWVSNVQVLPSDYLPAGVVGAVSGLSGCAAALGAMLFNFSTGWIVDNFSYTPVLVTAGVLAPLATGSLFLLAGRVRVLEIGERHA